MSMLCTCVSIVLFLVYHLISLFCLGIICAHGYIAVFLFFGSILTLRNSQKWIWDEVQSKSYPLPSSFITLKQQLNKRVQWFNNFKDSLSAFSSAADQRPFIMCMQPCIVRQAKRVISELFFLLCMISPKNILSVHCSFERYTKKRKKLILL